MFTERSYIKAGVTNLPLHKVLLFAHDYVDDDEKGKEDENDLESESGLFPRDWTLRRSWKLLPLNLLSFVGEAAHEGDCDKLFYKVGGAIMEKCDTIILQCC